MIRKLALGAALASLLAGAAAAQPYGPPPGPSSYGPPPGSGSYGPPAGPGAYGPPPGGMTAPRAPEFVRMAGQSDQFEIQSSRLAQTRARSAEVRNFGAMMVRDHGMTTRELMRAVSRTGRTPPPPPPLRPDQQAKVNDLASLRGRQFDRVYIDQQVASHQEALDLMQAYAANGDVPPLRRAAEKAVPIVRHHLEMAQGLQGGMR